MENKKRGSKKLLWILLILFIIALGVFLIVRYTELFGFIVSSGEVGDVNNDGAVWMED
ncbi:MAG: hypothetical protein NC820_08250 [Candidatus Omnitrophica bacterium]|nr:hypothetical protein [Candidatus Omnitrophota bacterium]